MSTSQFSNSGGKEKNPKSSVLA